jgi:pyroglutamyl-peptidase
MSSPILVTGFEPFMELGANPSAQLAERLDGGRIAGHAVIGRTLPVELAGLRDRLAALLAELQPAAVVATGLHPGAYEVRLERIAVNLADFEIDDNAGAAPTDEPLEEDGPLARETRLPVREIQAALLGQGIPARLSYTAGTYLCNATMYTLLGLTDAPAGFIHVPYTSAQVAELIQAGHAAADKRTELASLPLDTLEEALCTAVETTAAAVGAAVRA